jgi:hypothetical protein
VAVISRNKRRKAAAQAIDPAACSGSSIITFIVSCSAGTFHCEMHASFMSGFQLLDGPDVASLVCFLTQVYRIFKNP